MVKRLVCKSGFIGEREKERQRRMYKRKLESWPRGMTKRIRGVREKESERERKREGERGWAEERERREREREYLETIRKIAKSIQICKINSNWSNYCHLDVYNT